MDTATQPRPDPPSNVQGFSKSNRTWTAPADPEEIDGSGRSNGRSSLDSTSDRPKTQAGEVPDNAKPSRRLSKLLRKRKKKNDQGPADEMLNTDNARDALENRLNESRDKNSAASSLNGNSTSLENETSNILTDDSEPDRYV